MQARQCTMMFLPVIVRACVRPRVANWVSCGTGSLLSRVAWECSIWLFIFPFCCSYRHHVNLRVTSLYKERLVALLHIDAKEARGIARSRFRSLKSVKCRSQSSRRLCDKQRQKSNVSASLHTVIKKVVCDLTFMGDNCCHTRAVIFFSCRIMKYFV